MDFGVGIKYKETAPLEGGCGRTGRRVCVRGPALGLGATSYIQVLTRLEPNGQCASDKPLPLRNLKER
jgi:hypothetical protein